MKIIASAIAQAMIIIAIIISVILLFLRLIGFVPMTVLTGSMVPTYDPGDIVYVKPVENVSQLTIGDAVTFQEKSGVRSYVTHRIVGFGFDDAGNMLTVYTQGDANSVVDEPLKPEQIMGTIEFHIPKIGYISSYMKESPINTIIVASCGILYLGLIHGLQYYGNKEGKRQKGGQHA